MAPPNNGYAKNVTIMVLYSLKKKLKLKKLKFKMKVKINCPKCGSDGIKIISEGNDPTPMYKCNKCGYKHNLFPKFGNKQEEQEDLE